jgi:hypothetical protein
MANLSVGEEVSSGGTGQRDRENAWRRGPGHRRENPIRGALLGTGKLAAPLATSRRETREMNSTEEQTEKLNLRATVMSARKRYQGRDSGWRRPNRQWIRQETLLIWEQQTQAQNKMGMKLIDEN